MRTHPPLFDALTSRLDPQHPVNVLARKIAHRECRLLTRINNITEKYAPYYPPGWSEPHERDQR